MDPYLTKWTTRNNPVGTNRQDQAFGTSPDPYWETLRNAMGRAKTYADKANLAAMTPQNTLASTAYCLANPGHEYVVYQPRTDSAFTVSLKAGAYHYEWFNPSTGAVASSRQFTASAGEKTFTAPFSGDAVLYIADKNVRPR